MAIEVKINNVSIQYPQIGDTEWGNNATNFAIQTATAFNAIGLSDGTTVDLPGTLDVTGNTTLDANLSVAGIVNIDSGVLYVDPTNNRVGIVNSSPSKALDVTGEIQSSSHITCNGVVYADDDTTANTPVISFIGDTNTGIGRSASDTLDLITGGNSRFRIESTGQIKAVYESQVGTDYNTTLHNGYLCRAWVNFNGTGTVAIRASGNVSSITDNGTGDYTVNFTTAMPDANYSIVGICGNGSSAGTGFISIRGTSNPSTTNIPILLLNAGDVPVDLSFVCLAVFR